MKFIVQKNQLQEAISNVQKAVTGKSTMPILQGLLLNVSKNNITLVGSDKDLTIETKIEALVEKTGKIVVDSRLFGEIIRKLPNADIEICANDNNTISIKCLKSNATLVHMNADEYPALPIIHEETSFEIQQKIIKNMIKSTIFATAQDEVRPIFTGVLFELQNKKLNLVALDGYRVAIRSEYIDSDINISYVVPGKTLNEVSKILEESEENVHISFTSNHILFNMGKTKVISRLLEGEFIQYKSFIPKENNLKIIANREELLHSIERASLMGKDGNTSHVNLDVQEDALIITSNSQLGMAKEEVAIILQGEELKIAFNPKYLIDVFKIIDSEEITMEFYSEINPCTIKGKEKENSTYLLLPVRVLQQ